MTACQGSQYVNITSQSRSHYLAEKGIDALFDRIFQPSAKIYLFPAYVKKKKKKSASSVNRTRASSMATTNSTTRPMMLKNKMELEANWLIILGYQNMASQGEFQIYMQVYSPV